MYEVLLIIYLIGRKGMSSEAKTLLSPDKITRKRSFRDYENVRSTSHNIVIAEK